MSNLIFNSVAKNLNKVQLEKFNKFKEEFEATCKIKTNVHYTLADTTDNGLNKGDTVIFETQWDVDRNEPLVVMSNFNYRSSIIIYGEESIKATREAKNIPVFEEFHEKQRDMASINEMAELLKDAKFELAENFYNKMLEQLRNEIAEIEKVLEENKK